ncbi:MAG: hypothetical protein LBM93_02370 [Oscillospiraceae bacterium]|jgi:Fe-only nitrogenase accessory protein AnfO|nr:hypothetical protein [Oscillospiraceae bacterium]
MKIAVLKDCDGNISEFFNAVCFDIYEKKTDTWSVINKISFPKIEPNIPKILRKNTEELLSTVTDCSVIASKGLRGIPYSVFDMAGFHIFEIQEINSEILDEIVDDVRSANITKTENKEIITSSFPTETAVAGVYELDLVALQEKFPEISSKKALLDFMNNTPFMYLNLICKHIPPWIENSGKYNIEIKYADKDLTKAVISKKCAII